MNILPMFVAGCTYNPTPGPVLTAGSIVMIYAEIHFPLKPKQRKLMSWISPSLDEI